MNKQEIRSDSALQTLRKYKDDFESRFGITKIGIFGSVARDETKEDSDVDVVVEMKKPDSFYLVHIKETLENASRGYCSIPKQYECFFKGSD